MSLLLGREGARVAVVDLYRERAEKVAGEIQTQGGKAMGIAADVSALSDVDRIVAEVLK